MEILATNRLDGGVFIISGRTAAYRTSILQEDDFLHEFQNEYIQRSGYRIGPLNADDDNFIMRWLGTRDFKIWIQNGPAALMEPTIDSDRRKYTEQCYRWARTTWRSNPRSLWEGKVIYAQPWCLYAVYLSLFINFALIMDPLLMLVLHRAVGDQPAALLALGAWIFCAKLVKITPHLLRNLGDILLVPFYIGFGYYHSIIKFRAGITWWETRWGSRPEVDAVAVAATNPLPADIASKRSLEERELEANP